MITLGLVPAMLALSYRMREKRRERAAARQRYGQVPGQVVIPRADGIKDAAPAE